MEWTVETTHPREECVTCDGMAQDAIDMATAWDSHAYGSSMTDAQGTEHVVGVRRVV